MSRTKEKNGTKKQNERKPLTETEFILNKQIDDDLEDVGEYMEEGFQSN